MSSSAFTRLYFVRLFWNHTFTYKMERNFRYLCKIDCFKVLLQFLATRVLVFNQYLIIYVLYYVKLNIWRKYIYIFFWILLCILFHVFCEAKLLNILNIYLFNYTFLFIFFFDIQLIYTCIPNKDTICFICIHSPLHVGMIKTIVCFDGKYENDTLVRIIFTSIWRY